jgi:hypothetical protein
MMYSSCSFDCIANVVNNLLNPLHLSIALFKQENMATQPDSGARRAMNVPKQPSEADSKIAPNDTNSKRYCKPRSITARVIIYGSSISRPTLRTIDDHFTGRIHLVSNSNKAEGGNPCDAKTGKFVPGLPLSKVGQASRFGDETLGQNSRVNVFEVVLQSKEPNESKGSGTKASKYLSTTWRR